MPKDINGSKNIGKTTLGRSLSRSKNKSRQQQKDALRKARQSDKRQNSSVGGFTSVTEINSLDDFIISAEMADHEFAVERQNVVVIAGLTRATIKPDDKGDQLEHMTVPRRPAWNKAMTAEEVDHQEKVCVCVPRCVPWCAVWCGVVLGRRWGVGARKRRSMPLVDGSHKWAGCVSPGESVHRAPCTVHRTPVHSYTAPHCCPALLPRFPTSPPRTAPPARPHCLAPQPPNPPQPR